MKYRIKFIFIYLIASLFSASCFSAEELPKFIHYFIDSPVGQTKVTYTLNKLEENDLNNVERPLLGLLQKSRSRKFSNIKLARYLSKDFVLGLSVTPDMAPIDVIRIDYENVWLLRDTRKNLRTELLKNAKFSKLDEGELAYRVREFAKYDVDFLYYDPIGIRKGASELAFLIKGNSLIIFYYRYSWTAPIKILAKQIK